MSMIQKIKNRNHGFTIVETLIVLAIAGLIILIVLLAVPALQRSSRNTNIKSDAEAIAAAVNEYESNNSGSLPGLTTDTGGSATFVVGASGTTQSTAKIQSADIVKVVTTIPAANTAQIAGTITVMEGVTCERATSPRSTAIWFPVETAGPVSNFGTATDNCIDT